MYVKNTTADPALMKGQHSRLPLFIIIYAGAIFFPIFNVDPVDMSGYEGMDFYTTYHFIRLARLSIIMIISFVLLLQSMGRFTLPYRYKAEFIFFLLVSTTAISIILNTPSSVTSWLRFIEWSGTLFGCLALLNYMRSQMAYEPFEIENTFYKINILSFLAICPVLLYFLLRNREMIFWDAEGRGWRLGGYVIHSNTLGLGALICIISCRALLRQRIIQNFTSLVISMGSLIILLATKSFDAIFVLIMLYLISFTKALTGKTVFRKILVVSMILGTVLVFFLFPFAPYFLDGVEVPGSIRDRFIIYTALLPRITECGMWGHGFFGGELDYLKDVVPQTHWSPRHPHNLLLDIILSRGFIGGGIIILLILYVLTKCLDTLLRRDSRISPDIANIVISIVVTTLVEETFVGGVKSFCTAPFFFITFYLLSTSAAIRSGADNSYQGLR
jgi:O-antigen ligase